MDGTEGAAGGEPVLVAVSPQMQQVVELVDRVAASDCCVLIEGESGTGKELVARRLHARSRRADKPLIPVNCAGISEGLFESQFFGHLRGAFTGAEQSMLGLIRTADGGTLLLDEVGEIALGQQAKLLRVLQDGEVTPVGQSTPVKVDTRVVAATNRPLRRQVEQGAVREDLYYRLNVVRICLPPLRERADDVGPLLDHFLSAGSARHARAAPQVGRGVRRQLEAYPWPGNVRELASWVERLYATGLPAEVLAASLLAESAVQSRPPGREVLTLEQAERRAIAEALAATGNNRTEAARVLNIHRGTLLRKIAQHQIA